MLSLDSGKGFLGQRYCFELPSLQDFGVDDFCKCSGPCYLVIPLSLLGNILKNIVIVLITILILNFSNSVYAFWVSM